jgi:hypothetical protein
MLFYFENCVTENEAHYFYRVVQKIGKKFVKLIFISDLPEHSEHFCDLTQQFVGISLEMIYLLLTSLKYHFNTWGTCASWQVA